MHPLHDTAEAGSAAPVRLGTARPSAHITAIVDGLLPEGEGPDAAGERERVIARAAVFVAGQIDALPRRLRILFAAGMLFFRAVTTLTQGRTLCALPPSRRRAWVEAWAYGKWSLGRQLFRPLRSLAIVAYYSDPAVVDHFAATPRAEESLEEMSSHGA